MEGDEKNKINYGKLLKDILLFACMGAVLAMAGALSGIMIPLFIGGFLIKESDEISKGFNKLFNYIASRRESNNQQYSKSIVYDNSKEMQNYNYQSESLSNTQTNSNTFSSNEEKVRLNINDLKKPNMQEKPAAQRVNKNPFGNSQTNNPQTNNPQLRTTPIKK